MLWNDRLEQLRWRAVEETDVDGEAIPLVQRVEATRQASDLGDGFLKARVLWLRAHVPAEVLAHLRTPQMGLFSWACWGSAFLAGYVLTELGQEHLINVLAFPLMSILLWNAAMIVASLLLEWKASATTTGLPALMRKWLLRHPSPDRASLLSRSITRFHTLVDPLLALRIAARSRALLHVGAAVLALGAITGMYAKGWSREYRAVWESTLFDQPTASRLLSALYKPASVITGVAVPVNELTAMRAGPGRSPVPSDALPWIHLYASTLFLLVIVPRLALAGLTLWRGNRRIDAAWARLDWPLYAARLKSSVSGTGLIVEVLSHGWRASEEPRDRWSAALRERFGALALLQYEVVPAGDEDTFPKNWTPKSNTTVLVFNGATTPELEVQSGLARDLRARSREFDAAARMTALLDLSTLQDRRPPDAVRARVDLWRTMLRGWVDDVQTCG